MGCKRIIGIDDAAADHGEKRDNRSDLIGRHRGVVFVEDREVGKLSNID